MSDRDVTDAEIAMVRGVRSCGKHHEENETAPAVEFSKECRKCASKIFAVVWNHARETILTNLKNAGIQ